MTTTPAGDSDVGTSTPQGMTLGQFLTDYAGSHENVLHIAPPPKMPLARLRPPTACRVCGCTDEHACEGGCQWVSDPQMGDLCSACPPVPRADAPAGTFDNAGHRYEIDLVGDQYLIYRGGQYLGWFSTPAAGRTYEPDRLVEGAMNELGLERPRVVIAPLTAADFEVRVSEDRVVGVAPIGEDGDSFVGYGHIDPAAFLADLKDVDWFDPGTPEEAETLPELVQHRYAQALKPPYYAQDGGLWISWSIDGRPVALDDENAFPITLLDLS